MPKKDEYMLRGMSENELLELADLFKMFSDSTRIKILYDLFEGEKNVTEICEDIEMNQAAVSHQLKALKTAKLVRSRREGSISSRKCGDTCPNTTGTTDGISLLRVSERLKISPGILSPMRSIWTAGNGARRCMRSTIAANMSAKTGGGR